MSSASENVGVSTALANMISNGPEHCTECFLPSLAPGVDAPIDV